MSYAFHVERDDGGIIGDRSRYRSHRCMEFWEVQFIEFPFDFKAATIPRSTDKSVGGMVAPAADSDSGT